MDQEFQVTQIVTVAVTPTLLIPTSVPTPGLWPQQCPCYRRASIPVRARGEISSYRAADSIHHWEECNPSERFARQCSIIVDIGTSTGKTTHSGRDAW
jgi:hypothetical protein